VWQRTWDDRGRTFQMLGVAQDAQGEERVRPVVEERSVSFPVLVDSESLVGRELGFRIVPSGFFVDARGIVRYRHTDDFDIGDPRVRWNLEQFLAGEPIEPSPELEDGLSPEALEQFAVGVALYRSGQRAGALAAWRAALALDPDNFLIRSQIWALEHPERFYPEVDREWQELQLAKEGYDKPLP
jgi:tetratricopeptide (TPR) repeat protein